MKPFNLPADFVGSVQPYRQYTHSTRFYQTITIPRACSRTQHSVPIFFFCIALFRVLTRPRAFSLPFHVNMNLTANHKLRNDFRPRRRKKYILKKRTYGPFFGNDKGNVTSHLKRNPFNSFWTERAVSWNVLRIVWDSDHSVLSPLAFKRHTFEHTYKRIPRNSYYIFRQ
jgi:hypothetical protein